MESMKQKFKSQSMLKNGSKQLKKELRKRFLKRSIDHYIH